MTRRLYRNLRCLRAGAVVKGGVKPIEWLEHVVEALETAEFPAVKVCTKRQDLLPMAD